VGYKAISTDRALGKRPCPTLTTRCGTSRKAVSLASRAPSQTCCFVCGSSGNRDRFLPYFTKIFNLRIDDDTMRRRPSSAHQ